MFKLMATILLIGAFLFSCSEDVVSKTQYLYKKNAGDGIAAKIGDIKITDQELIDDIQGEIYEAEVKVFEIKINKLKSMLLEKLMNAHPGKKGLSNDAFMEKFIAKSIKITEQDINAFIKEKKIPKEHINPQIKERINGFLMNEKKKAAVDVWVANQLKKTPVEVFIDKPTRPTYDVKVGNAASWGNKKAKVTIVEYSDFQCPYCAKGADILKQLKKKYGNKIQVAFKQFPLPFHNQAKVASVAALCANEQKSDYFWKLHDHMFANQDKLDPVAIKAQAKNIGLNVDKFNKCLDGNKYLAQVEADIAEGKKIGVRSTPTFFVNGQLVQGAQPIENFAEIIDAAL